MERNFLRCWSVMKLCVKEVTCSLWNCTSPNVYVLVVFEIILIYVNGGICE